MISDMCDAKITAAGIHYLKNNSVMQKIGEQLKTAADIIAKLAGLLMI